MRWLSDGEVVSASTDSTLRLWDIHSARESRIFRGHVNEKNFVGLAADSEFIACGSETNEVLPQIVRHAVSIAEPSHCTAFLCRLSNSQCV